MAKQKWTDAQRDQALALYAKHGAAEAHRQTGVPRPTITSWARRAGMQSDATGKIATAVAVAAMTWAQRRLTIADSFGDAAAEFLEYARASARNGDGRVAQALVTSAAISIDKAQLLTGGATGRVEHGDVSTPDGRLAIVHNLQDAVQRRSERAEETG